MQLMQWYATAHHRFGTSRRVLRAAGMLAGIVGLALCTLVLITGCTERGAPIQGTSGPVAWQVTDISVIEREISGAANQKIRLVVTRIVDLDRHHPRIGHRNKWRCIRVVQQRQRVDPIHVLPGVASEVCKGLRGIARRRTARWRGQSE